MLALACAALAGVASGGSVWRAEPGAVRALPVAFEEGVAVVLGLVIGGGLLQVWQSTPETKRRRKRRRRLAAADFEGVGGAVRTGTRWAAVVIAAVVVFIAVLLPVVRRGSENTHPPRPATDAVHASGRDSAGRASGGAGRSLGVWFGIGLGGVLLLLGPVAVVRRRRQRPPVSGTGALVVEAARESIDDLERERDARRAVVRAYVRMTEACATADVARQPDETPSEYLPRVLRTLRVSAAPIERLTALFEEARFGGGTVGRAMQRDAVAALRRVCAELER
jgi:hypothetical protein